MQVSENHHGGCHCAPVSLFSIKGAVPEFIISLHDINTRAPLHIRLLTCILHESQSSHVELFENESHSFAVRCNFQQSIITNRLRLSCSLHYNGWLLGYLHTVHPCCAHYTALNKVSDKASPTSDKTSGQCSIQAEKRNMKVK